MFGFYGNPVDRQTLPAGIYAPTVTFFDTETEDLDIPTIKKHAVRLAQAGLVGLVVMGSNGEAVHCTQQEKIAVTVATREALDDAGFHNVLVLAGATEGSVRGTVELSKAYAKAGAAASLVLPPCYYRAQVDNKTLLDYFLTIADQSPIPLVLYNYPAAVSGIDMDSDILIKLAEHPNIIGTKFTCGNSGKLTRVAHATNAKTASSEGSGYLAFGGICDFLAQTFFSGGSGAIAGGANVMPKVCVKIWNLCIEGKHDEAVRLQKELSRADWFLTGSAISGTKSAIEHYFGYGGYPRSPLRRLEKDMIDNIVEGIRNVMEIEESL